MAKERISFELTFFDIAYSLGGRSGVDRIYKSLDALDKETRAGKEIIDLDLLTEKERVVLHSMCETYKRDGMFPSWTFLQEAYQIVSNAPVRNLGDFNTALNSLLDTRRGEMLKNEISYATVQAKDHSEYVEMIDKAKSKFSGIKKTNTFTTFTSTRSVYEYLENAPQGILTGIKEIDELTAGLQMGTVATVAGFTSHGKSTVSNNIAYVNALRGKKVGVVSLEIVAQLCKYIYLSRHSYTMNKYIEYSTLVRSGMTAEQKRLMYEVIEPDFMEKVAPNLSIIETSDIPSYSMRGFEQMYQMLEETLGGLDLVIWDHVNQFKYVNSDSWLTGDHYIKMLTDISKSYVNRKGLNPVTLFVVQTNREGYRRAARNGGEYDLTALSDFNEIEKSSTYVMFIYADESQREGEQAQVQLKKHRLGRVMIAPTNVSVYFKYSAVGDNFENEVASIDPLTLSNAAEQWANQKTKSDFIFENEKVQVDSAPPLPMNKVPQESEVVKPNVDFDETTETSGYKRTTVTFDNDDFTV